jgi:aryl-alcohol dehydrogenase-like predicted oxidoreductase
LEFAIEQSLRRLRIESIPLYLVHWPDPNTPLDETLRYLEQARMAGKIMAYGLSNFGFPALRGALAFADIAALEGPLSLLSPESDLKQYTDTRGLNVNTLTYGPLAQGLLTGKYTAHSVFDSSDRRHRLGQFSVNAYNTNRHVLEALAHVSRELGRSPAEVAIRWVMDTGASTSVIFGAKAPSQVLENHSALSWSLAPAHLERLRIARQLTGLVSGDVVAGRSDQA